MPKQILAAWTLAEFAACAIAFLPAMAVAHVRHRDDPTRRVQGQWMRRFGRTTTSLTPLWQFSVEGTPPADIADHAYVVVANHESNADPFLLSHLPWDMRWVAKDSLFKLPWLGWMMKLGGDVPLRRGEKDSAKAMSRECIETLERGLSIMIFPEGTRSRDGNLLPFKDGAFRLAIDAGVPILPVALAGTRDCIRKGSAQLGEARAIARVLEPIPSQGMTIAQLRDLSRARIADGVASIRTKLAAKANQEEASRIFA